MHYLDKASSKTLTRTMDELLGFNFWKPHFRDYCSIFTQIQNSNRKSPPIEITLRIKAVLISIIENSPFENTYLKAIGAALFFETSDLVPSIKKRFQKLGRELMALKDTWIDNETWVMNIRTEIRAVALAAYYMTQEETYKVFYDVTSCEVGSKPSTTEVANIYFLVTNAFMAEFL